jgi:beta-lactamase class A
VAQRGAAAYRPAAQPPAALREQIIALSRAFDGKAGIAIVSLRDGWEISWNANTFFPQQSCSKLWVSITALDEVDRQDQALR